MTPRLAATLVLTGIVLAPAMAAGDTGPRPAGPPALEKRRDPFMPTPSQPPRRSIPLLVPVVGPYVSIQVNVSAPGVNIVGDAANEPSIAVDPTAPNRMVIGWRQFDNVASDFRQAGYAYTRDGGRTWTFPGKLDPGVFRSDPVLGADRDGMFYYMSLKETFNMDLFKSTDGGITWGFPVPAFGGDKEWLAIDQTAGPGSGNIYSSWQHVSPFAPNQFTRSIDGGDSFQAPLVLPSRPFFGTLAVASDGAVYICGIDAVGAGGRFHVLRSDNAQNPLDMPTFALDQVVDLGGVEVLGGAVNPIGLLGQPWVAENPISGDIYLLCSVRPPAGDPLDVHFVSSHDRGLTWSAPVRINDDAPGNQAWQWFGTMSVAPNGRIDVIWNDTRNDPGNPDPTTSELFYSFSMDGGATWAANVAVSPPFLHHIGYPQNEKLGDYYQMTSDQVGANVAYAATFNGEQDVWYLRIGDYDCNGNGIPDSVDLANDTSHDCNSNGIPDECDIASGTSKDVNHNGVPDECETIIGKLDIKPGSCPNPLNPKSRGVLPVALVGMPTFQVADVVLTSLQLARSDGVGGSVAPIFGPPGPHPVLADVATPFPGAPCDCHALGGDGIIDLELKFRTEDLVQTLQLSLQPSGAKVSLALTGELTNGLLFKAEDCITIVPVAIASQAY